MKTVDEKIIMHHIETKYLHIVTQQTFQQKRDFQYDYRCVFIGLLN